jgi:hypothetical protein
MSEQSAAPDKRVRIRHRLSFTLVAALLLLVVVLLPFAVDSLVENVAQPDVNRVYPITPADTPFGYTYSRLRVRLVTLDEWSGQLTLQVSGVHVCQNACLRDYKFLFVSVPLGDSEHDGLLPPAQSVSYPPNAMETTQLISLPVYGDSLRFPFDTYRLRLGVVMEKSFPDGSATVLSPDDAYGHVFLSIAPHVARTTLQSPISEEPVGLRPYRTPFQYVYVTDLVLQRPLYLRVLAVLLVLLAAAAGSYAVLMRPLHELVINAGALVLGVWGIRAILLGTAVPGLTAVDLALAVIILFLLTSLTVRAFRFLQELNAIRLSLRRPERTPSDTRVESASADEAPTAH